jgi:hypothetical protein
VPHFKHSRGLRDHSLAFGLTDVAGAVVCIALVAALTAATATGIREDSKQTVCLSRLRDIATATAVLGATDGKEMALPVHPLFYAQDPSNPSFIGAYEWGGKSGIGRDTWLTGGAGDPLNSKYGTKAGFGPAARPLNDILYPHGFRNHEYPEFNAEGATTDTELRLKAFRCPADDGPPVAAHCPDWIENPQRSSYDHFGSSYAANIFMTSVGVGTPTSSNSPYLRSLSRVPNPARTYNYEENIGRWAWTAKRLPGECSFVGEGVDPGPTKSIRGWHGKAWVYNHAFVDGHAARSAIYIEGTEDSEGYAQHYLIEQVFEDDLSQEGFQCIIVRGDGWQKDTLPDPRIETGLLSTSFGRPSYEDCVTGE